MLTWVGYASLLVDEETGRPVAARMKPSWSSKGTEGPLDALTEEEIRDLRGLTRLQALVTDGPEIYTADLVPLTRRCVLRLHFSSPAPDALAAMTELRSLDVSWCEVTDLAFVRFLPRLRILSLDATPVRDLNPLAGHPSLERLSLRLTLIRSLAPVSKVAHLEEIDATESEVRELPRGTLPRLRLLRAVSARIPEVDAANFREQNPAVVLHARWLDPLLERVAGADRLRLQSGGWDVCGEAETTLFETTEPTEIRKLLGVLDISEERAEGSGVGECCCSGGPKIEFFAGRKPLVSMSIHHGCGLRWRAGWPGDAWLTEKGIRDLALWLKTHGAAPK